MVGDRHRRSPCRAIADCRDPFEIDRFPLPQRRPQIPDLVDARRHRRNREVASIDPLVDFLPGQRRGHAGVVAGARAVGGRERLAEDVLQAIDVDALARARTLRSVVASFGCFCATTVATIWQ